MGDLGNGVLWGALASVATALGAWIITLYKERTSNQRVVRADTITEWEKLAGTLQKQLDFQRAQLNELAQQVLAISREHAQCLAQNIEMEREIENLKRVVFQMQKGCDKDGGCPMLLDPIDPKTPSGHDMPALPKGKSHA